jgi:transcription-repair coupling factor (superfamily II helicase)
MGLSQLYQLRGRVGRSSEQAYAYFLTPAQREASELALRRLQALEQYTDLGSGFQIAMRDLEIRGAGNILGTMQHGFIAAVGFDLYCSLLEEAVKDLRGEKPGEKQADASVDIAIEAYLPTDYVVDQSARIEVYHKLSGAQKPEDVNEMETELVDRFGPLPQVVFSLLLLIRIKVLAKLAGCSKVSINSEGICTFTIEGDTKKIQAFIKRIGEKTSKKFEITNAVPTLIKMALSGNSASERALEIKNILQ